MNRGIKVNYLTKDYWEKFKPDGKLFEELAKVLIEYEYNDKDFSIVGGPSDGGKDIIKKIDLLDRFTTEIWAECKFRKKTLSAQDISYTFLMAHLKCINLLLIFSYSKVTKSFNDQLTDYRARTGREVIVYSDRRLENLILKHRTRLLTEHPEFFSDIPDFHHPQDAIIQSDYKIYIGDTSISSQKVSVNLNTIIEVVLSVTNCSDKDIRIRLERIRGSIENRFNYIDEHILDEYDIPANRSKIVKTYVRLKRFISHTKLPRYRIVLGCNKLELKTNTVLECRWLADAVLIGQKYYDALERIRYSVSYPHFNLVYIYGQSGVGKSRLIKEIQNGKEGIDYNFIYIDTDKKEISCKKLIEILCSKTTQLPILEERVKYITSLDESSMEYGGKILYDHSFSVSDEWENISKFIANQLIEQQFILALDNIQHFDKLTLDILEYVIDILKVSKSKSKIILGINSDYVYKNSVFEEFFCRLKFSSSSNEEYFTSVEITGFEDNDNELYIRECLSYLPTESDISEIEYEKTIKKMAKHCGCNPFYIQQYLLFLYQKNILRRSENTLFYFYDLKGFTTSFRQIPKSIQSLIEQRELAYLSEKQEAEIREYNTLIYLINLNKSLPTILFDDLTENRDILIELQELGFLSVSNGYITPIHSYYLQYYNKKYPVESIPMSVLEKYLTSVNNLYLEEELILPCFWSKYRLKNADYDDLEQVISKLDSLDFDFASFSFCIDAVSKMVEYNKCKLSIERYHSIYYKICRAVDKELGMNLSLKYYQKYLDAFLDIPNRFENIIDSCITLFLDYLIHLINLEQYDSCTKKIERIRTIKPSLCEVNRMKIDYHTNRCLIMIYNRNDDVPNGINTAKENLRIINSEKLPEHYRKKNSYSAKRAIGNIYFYSTVAQEKKEEITKSWMHSFNSYIFDYGFSDTDNFSNQPKVAAYAKGLAAQIITENEYKADKIARFFINAFDKMHMIYYEMQIRLLIAIYYTWKYSDCSRYSVPAEEIIDFIDQTIDIAAIYGRELTTINAFHLKGVLFYILGDLRFAFDNYAIAAEFLSQYISSAKDCERWMYFWIDYARVIRLGGKKNHVDLSFISSNKVRSEMKKIIGMSEKEFADYEDSFIPLTAITDKKHKVNFPKI